MSSTASEVPGWWFEFQAAVLRQMPRPHEIDQVTAKKWMDNQRELKRVLRRSLIPPVNPHPLFGEVKTVEVPASNVLFFANEKFVVNTDRNTAHVLIAGIHESFSQRFLNGKSTVEQSTRRQKLRYARLLASSLYNPICAELGGNDFVETTLSQLYFLMELQKFGEPGALLSGRMLDVPDVNFDNVFFIKDANDVLCAVKVRWIGNGWHLSAQDLALQKYAWDKGTQVFSCDFILVPPGALEPWIPVPA